MTVTTTRRRVLGWLGLAPAAGLPVAAVARAAHPPVRFLFARVNGEAYYDAQAALPSLSVGAPVRLLRQPDNPYDRRAVEVFDDAGRKLGYVARIDNSALARMMDAGEAFTARIGRLGQPLDIRLEIDWLSR